MANDSKLCNKTTIHFGFLFKVQNICSSFIFNEKFNRIKEMTHSNKCNLLN